jgi:hypothetical protein
MLPSPLVAPAVSAFCLDFLRLRIGVAEHSEGPTGVAVFSSPERAPAIATNASVASAIRPFHAERESHSLFAASSAEVSAADSGASDVGILSSELACAAVLKCVPKLFTELENVDAGKS